MINKISTKDLTSKEFFMFLSLVIGIADKTDVAKSKIKPERDALNNLLPDLQTALAIEAANEETQKLIAADKRRDIAISGFAAWLKSLLKNPKQAKREAAATILNYLKAFGSDIAGENSAAESATLSTIAKDCTTKTDLVAALTVVDGSEWINEIEVSNNVYIDLYKNRTTSISDDKKVKSFTALRPRAKTAYDTLVTIISSRYNTGLADGLDTAALKTCIDDMNSTIDQYKQLILATLSRKKEEPKKEGDR
jgi:hypothetical protein